MVLNSNGDLDFSYYEAFLIGESLYDIFCSKYKH